MREIRNRMILVEIILGIFMLVNIFYKAYYLPTTAEITTKKIESIDNIKKVALTFDDGPSPKYTDTLLDGLATRGVKVTFFLIGEKAEEYPDIVKHIYNAGHLIGNHSYGHVNLNELPDEEACSQVNKMNQVISEITGETPEYLRSPFGSRRKNLDCEMNMIEVSWDIDPRDWEVKDTDTIVNRVVTNVSENDIILLHDKYATSVAAALQIIDTLQAQGYEFVTVDELIFE